MNTQRIGYIDGIKGVSALIVVLHHLMFAFLFAFPDVDNLNHTPFLRLVFSGNYAVFLFVLLSSMLVEYQLRDKLTLEKCQSIILKRYFRLMIPIAVILLIMLSMKEAGLFFHLEFAKLTGNPILGTDTMEIGNLPKVMLMAPLGRSYGWLGVLWMLNYILLGTFFCIILALGLRNVSFYKQLIVLFGVVFIAYIYDTLYASVVLGFSLARLLPTLDKTKWGGYLLAGISLIVIITIELSRSEVNLNFFLSAATFLLILSFPLLRIVFSCRPLSFLGRISLEIYLIHDAIIYSFSCFCALNVDINPLTISIISGGTLVIVLPCAYLLHYALDPITRKLTNGIVNWITN